jgi:hypothetical protein
MNADKTERKETFKRVIIIVILFSMMIAFVISGFKYLIRDRYHYNFLDFYIGKVEILKSDNCIEPADIKKELFLSDKVRTYESSKAYIQFGTDHLVEVAENTILAMTTLPLKENSADDSVEINIILGKIFINAGRLTSKGKLNVTNRTSTIAVRGTVFSVEATVDF